MEDRAGELAGSLDVLTPGHKAGPADAHQEPRHRHSDTEAIVSTAMPLVSNRICARICARDAAGEGATRETPRFGIDAPSPLTEISAATRDRARRQRQTSYGS
jgi:hypothetical protein